MDTTYTETKSEAIFKTTIQTQYYLHVCVHISTIALPIREANCQTGFPRQALHVSRVPESCSPHTTPAIPAQLPFLLKEDSNVGRPSQTWVTMSSPTADPVLHPGASLPITFLKNRNLWGPRVKFHRRGYA